MLDSEHIFYKKYKTPFFCTKKNDKTMSKKVRVRQANAAKYERARELFFRRVPLQDICQQVDITPATLASWRDSDAWEAARATRDISVDALIAKAMRRADQLLESDKDFNADAFAKVIKQIKELQKEVAPNVVVSVFTDFGDWLIERSQTDEALSTAFIQGVTKYQDEYLSHILKRK